MSDIADEIFWKEIKNIAGDSDVDEDVSFSKSEGGESEVSLDEGADMEEGFGE